MGDGVLVPGEFVLAYMEALAAALTEADIADALPAFIRRMDPVFAGLMAVLTRDVLMSENSLRPKLNFHLKSGEVVRFEAPFEFFCLYLVYDGSRAPSPDRSPTRPPVPQTRVHGSACGAFDLCNPRVERFAAVSDVTPESNVWDPVAPGLGVDPRRRDAKQLGHVVSGEELVRHG